MTRAIGSLAAALLAGFIPLTLAPPGSAADGGGPEQQGPIQHGPVQKHGPVQAPAPCQPKVVVRTVMVPETYYESVNVPVTVYRPEYYDQTVTVMRRVPEVHPVRVVSTVMDRRTEMRTVNFPVSIPTWRTVERQVTVMVPHTEMRQGVRMIAKPVRETVMETVCRDAGHFECRTHVDCYGCKHTCEVWVPQVIKEQVPVIVCRTEYIEQPYNYPVTVCHPEVRVVSDRVCDVHVEMRSREVPYTYCVPRQVERVVNQTTFRCVPEEKVVRRMRMVPHVEYRPTQVCRTRMVSRQITCVVPCDCDSCW